MENRTSISSPPLEIRIVEKWMDAETLLSQRGLFYLIELFEVLDREKTGKYKLAFKQIERIREKGASPSELMGYMKYAGRIAVLMERFSPWYRENLIFKTQKLDGSMGFGAFLKQVGIFRLSEVCKVYRDFLPYTYSILKRNADKCANPDREIGVFKYDTTYLVLLPRFEEWLREEMLS